jgi:uncharacterized protein (UPF0548 family)
MWFVRRPSAGLISAFLQRQGRLPFSYPQVGASAGEAPDGYDLDHNRARLGAGRAVFDAACDALRRWAQFPAPWTAVHPADAPLEPGSVVAVLARAFGLWWLSAARVVYAVEEAAPLRRFGFAYGTLPGHVEEGEERFTVEWHADGSVWYDLRAFSRPRHPLVRLAYPLARRQQRRFVRDSQAAMRRAVSAAGPAGVECPST